MLFRSPSARAQARAKIRPQKNMGTLEIRRRLALALVVLLATGAASVAGYRLLSGPNVSLLDAVYMAIITLAGVGYGEIVDTSHNPLLRIFNMFVVLVGVTTTVYVFSVVTAFLVEGEITNIFWRRKMQKLISQLSGHYIVDRKSTRLNSSHIQKSRMPSSA